MEIEEARIAIKALAESKAVVDQRLSETQATLAASSATLADERRAREVETAALKERALLIEAKEFGLEKLEVSVALQEEKRETARLRARVQALEEELDELRGRVPKVDVPDPAPTVTP